MRLWFLLNSLKASVSPGLEVSRKDHLPGRDATHIAMWRPEKPSNLTTYELLLTIILWQFQSIEPPVFAGSLLPCNFVSEKPGDSSRFWKTKNQRDGRLSASLLQWDSEKVLAMNKSLMQNDELREWQLQTGTRPASSTHSRSTDWYTAGRRFPTRAESLVCIGLRNNDLIHFRLWETLSSYTKVPKNLENSALRINSGQVFLSTKSSKRLSGQTWPEFRQSARPGVWKNLRNISHRKTEIDWPQDSLTCNGNASFCR